jgi:pyruvate/2-oxoglutarate dehydrogenase complex dihydrolipoamide dehydrogenase (E3) component
VRPRPKLPICRVADGNWLFESAVERIETDLCIVGAGSAGLSVAAGAAQMGARTVLVERARMGGDCLNVGCVPSKALIAAAQAAETIRRAGRFGVDGHEPEIDFAKVHAHVHDVIATIAPVDSAERYERLGARVLNATARFVGPTTLETDAGQRIEARRVVVATGSRPAVPPVPGLDSVPYLTNETVFDARTAPAHLIVLGAGPIGCELAQAHRRLGCKVSLLDLGPILPKDDPELVEVLRARLRADGVDLYEHVQVQRVEPDGNGVAVVLAGKDGPQRLEGSDLLVATGRRPVVDTLDLEQGGVAFDKSGLEVDAHLRSVSNAKVYGCGDVVGHYQFTHVASYQASIVIKNVLFRWPAKVDYRAVPRVTYTDPEIAAVGPDEADARVRGAGLEVLRVPFRENDRAVAERATEGLIKLLVGKGGRVVGAGIAGAHAGELIGLWALAVHKKLKVGDVATMIAPYPTLGEISKRAAGAHYAPKLFGPGTHRLVRLLARLG